LSTTNPNDTTAQYAAIHCPHQRTVGPAVQPADMPHQTAALNFYLDRKTQILG